MTALTIGETTRMLDVNVLTFESLACRVKLGRVALLLASKAPAAVSFTFLLTVSKA